MNYTVSGKTSAKVAIDSSDNAPGFLVEKLGAGNAITLTSLDGKLVVDVASGALTPDWSAIANKPQFGSAAALNTGTGSGEVVQLDANGKMPAVDGSQLTNVHGGAVDFTARLSDLTNRGMPAGYSGGGVSFYSSVASDDGDNVTAFYTMPDGSCTMLLLYNAKSSVGAMLAADNYQTSAYFGTFTGHDFSIRTSNNERLRIKADGSIIMASLPTSDPGVSGQLWNDNGTLRVAAEGDHSFSASPQQDPYSVASGSSVDVDVYISGPGNELIESSDSGGDFPGNRTLHWGAFWNLDTNNVPPGNYTFVMDVWNRWNIHNSVTFNIVVS